MPEELEEIGAEFLVDPYPLYARLRHEQPVHPAGLNGIKVWLVTRHTDVRAMLADPRLRKDSDRVSALIAHQLGMPGQDPEVAGSPGERMLVGHMLNMDPPDHERLRSLVGKVFTGRRVEALRPRVEQITARLVAGLPRGEQVDLLAAFAYPLPVTVISEMLGVPDSDQDKFRTWADALATARGAEHLQETAGELAAYLASLVEAKRAAPDDALISALAQQPLGDDELVSMVFQLLVAGYETTAHLIGNGLLALLDHPDQLAALSADRSLLPGAVEEFLRYNNSLHLATMRYTAEPVEIGGVTIPEGEFVICALGSGNHDGRRYPNAERFDITRDTAGHLAFGHGIHHCLGAPLARLVASVAFAGLLDRFGRIELAVPPDELKWQVNLTRSLEELPVRLG